MKALLLLLLLTLIASCQSKKESQASGTKKLVWSEDFDYTGLPDSTKWQYEEGLVRNNEAQYYTRARLKSISPA